MKLTLQFRITAALIGGLVLVVALCLGLFFLYLNEFSRDRSASAETSIMNSHKDQLVEMVALAQGVVESHYAMSQDTEALKAHTAEELKRVLDAVTNQVHDLIESKGSGLTPSELEAEIKALVRAARFDGDNYIWIHDLGHTMVMHPAKPELEGRDMTDFQDPNGVFLFQEMVDLCVGQGEGVVEYSWAKPGEEEPKLKISYVRLIEEMGWIVGVGAWVEDLEVEMQGRALEQLRSMRLPGGNYFWVHQATEAIPAMVMHPTVPSLEGQAMSEEKYICATHAQFGLGEEMEELGEQEHFFLVMNRVALESGQGFVMYQWPKPLERGVTEETYPKLACVMHFEPWGWVIGMGEYVDAIETMVAQEKSMFSSSINAIMTRTGLLSLLCMLLLALAGYIFTRRDLIRPVAALRKGSMKIAQGDLDAGFEGKFTAELLDLKESMETMVSSLKQEMETAHAREQEAAAESRRAERALKLATKAGKKEEARRLGMISASDTLEVVVMALDQASQVIGREAEHTRLGAKEQKDRIAEIAGAVDQINQSILGVAQSASDASSLAEESRVVAGQGAEVAGLSRTAMEQVKAKSEALMGKMEELDGKAESIGQVMNMINDIADQTNLLALNAAIEAARAGDAGRGFAVVADEVRKLAEKTMAATSDVDSVIRSIQLSAKENAQEMEQAMRAVHEASELVDESGQALAGIADLVGSSTDQVRIIATATEEQSAASEQVQRTMTEIVEVCTRNEEGVRNCMEHISQVGEQVQELTKLNGVFRIIGQGAAQKAVEKLAISAELGKDDRKLREDALKRLAQDIPAMELVYMTDIQGRQVTDTIPGMANQGLTVHNGFGQDRSARPWFTGAMKEGDTFVSPIYTSEATGEQCLTIATPVLRDDHPVGVLGVDIRLFSS
ncbi:MAG: HAMP domain-containing protein [Desulfovibrio sp.]|nr:MAG: HAMP domain-containing protein [Desulfovibrio sp.]